LSVITIWPEIPKFIFSISLCEVLPYTISPKFDKDTSGQMDGQIHGMAIRNSFHTLHEEHLKMKIYIYINYLVHYIIWL